MKIRRYNQNDIKEVFRLWKSTIGAKWPIEFPFFFSIIEEQFENTIHYVAETNQGIIGFIASRYGNLNLVKPRASIFLLLVESTEQKKGIGKQLLEIVVDELKLKNIYDIQLGAGAGSYFWPGVPENLPGAISFFQSCGWNFSETSVDLVADLEKFVIPKGIKHNKEILITHPKENDISKLLKFEKENFPNWYIYFQFSIDKKDYENILIAQDQSGNIIGSALIHGPYKSKCKSEFKWKTLLGNTMGGFGVIGVHEKFRRQGIGMSIAIKASLLLKSRGVLNSYLGWTWLVDWYGKLGYEIWRSYKMSWKKL